MSKVNSQPFYLKPNVQVEPLFNQWPAWPYLIPPTTAAMNIANLHLRVMESFVMAPHLHEAAAKQPGLRGGQFLNLDPRRSGKVKALYERTVAEQSHMVDLAEAIRALNEMLMEEAKGHSMEGLYQKVPGPLKGYVELVYDLNNQPSARFLEGLLYRSPYYDPSRQSISLSLVHSDNRPFRYTTPQVEDGQSLHMKLPFDHAGLDELFAMRGTPLSFESIIQALALPDRQHEQLRAFLTTEPPRPFSRYTGDGIRIRYLNHACLLIETKAVNILTDPLVAYEYERTMPCYSYADLPDVINYALITHGHADHMVLETLLQLRHRIETLVTPKSGGGSLEDPSLKLLLENIGFKNVIEIGDMESIAVPGGDITGLPFLGEHADLNIRGKIAYMIRLGGKSVVCATDSRNVAPELYRNIHHAVGDVDTLFLGMECDGAPLSWMYGQLCARRPPREMDQSRRLNGSDYKLGIEIVNELHCRQVYVYAMGHEPWLNFLTSIHYTEQSKPIVESNKLVEACRSRNIVSERLYGSKEMFL